MDLFTRILCTVPIIHPATVTRLITWPGDNDLTDHERMLYVVWGLSQAWARLHSRPATAQDVVAWIPKQVPSQWIFVILNVPQSRIAGIWYEINAWAARGIIRQLPTAVDDPGAEADWLLRQRLISRL